MNSTWTYVFCTASIMGLLVYLYRDHQRDKALNQVLQLKARKKTSMPAEDKKFEPLRQMALVQKDEFNEFYMPVIDKINEYETLINLPKTESKYFDLVLKSLRKRRTVIFEHHSAETNRENHPFWTLALFLAILCRYTIRLLNSVEFRNTSKRTVIPYVESIAALYGTEIRKKSNSQRYPPKAIYLHIVEQLVDADVLVMLSDRGIYPFLINAVTGNFQQRKLPFYTIIESVENHVLGVKQDENTWFRSTVESILALIENNTILKNTKDALVFESVYHLYIDRHLFWELFKTYSIFEQRLMTKHDFETRVIDIYKLSKTTLGYDTIRITVPMPDMADPDFDYFIEITNLLALPYSTIPEYVPEQKIRTKRIKTDRKIQFEESGVILDEVEPKQNKTKTSSEDGKHIEQSASKKARIKNRRELFQSADKH